MIRVLIVEDEKPAQERLRGLLKDIGDIELVGVAETGQEAVEMNETIRPDLLFLDIHLPDLSGIDLLAVLKYKPRIIFTTAYEEFAIKAFEMNAIDYLLKPFGQDRLNQAVQKAREKLTQGSVPIEQLKSLLKNWEPAREHLTRIPSRIGDRIFILVDDEIMYISSDHRLVTAYLYDDKYIINYKLEDLQQRLNPGKFFRIHRSSIVNFNYIAVIESWFAGGYKVKIKDKTGTELIISRSSGKLLKQKLGW